MADFRYVRLTVAALSHAREHGYEIVTVWVLSQNTQARAFYVALGFTSDGSERTDTQLIGTPLREVRYGISLGRAGKKALQPTGWSLHPTGRGTV